MSLFDTYVYFVLTLGTFVIFQLIRQSIKRSEKAYTQRFIKNEFLTALKKGNQSDIEKFHKRYPTYRHDTYDKEIYPLLTKYTHCVLAENDIIEYSHYMIIMYCSDENWEEILFPKIYNKTSLIKYTFKKKYYSDYINSGRENRIKRIAQILDSKDLSQLILAANKISY